MPLQPLLGVLTALRVPCALHARCLPAPLQPLLDVLTALCVPCALHARCRPAPLPLQPLLDVLTAPVEDLLELRKVAAVAGVTPEALADVAPLTQQLAQSEEMMTNFKHKVRAQRGAWGAAHSRPNRLPTGPPASQQLQVAEGVW